MTSPISTSTLREVTVCETAAELCELVANEFLRHIAAVQARHGSASVVLTGGRTGTAVLERVSDLHANSAVDWACVDVYWSDERFVPRHHADRNELQARDALLNQLPIDPTRVHAMPSSDDGDATTAAVAYHEALDRVRRPHRPLFDLCLLGVGEDGHVASLFPGLHALTDLQRWAVAVHNSPKPPSTRITLTLPAIRNSADVWLFTTGAAKAAAVASALDGETGFPAAHVRGVNRTRWFLDTDAASEL